jgi:hypothetical protein
MIVEFVVFRMAGGLALVTNLFSHKRFMLEIGLNLVPFWSVPALNL